MNAIVSGASAPASGLVPANPSITPPLATPSQPQTSEPQSQPASQPRDDQGRFTSPNPQDNTTLAEPPAAPATPANNGAPAPEAVTESAEQQRQKEQNRTSANERIRQITSQKYEALNKADRLARENQALRKQLAELGSADQNDPSVQVRTAVKTERLEQTAHEFNSARQDAANARQMEFNAKINAARGSIPNLDTALHSFMQLPVGEIAADVIASSDKAAEIAHYLGTNPDEFYRINNLPGHLQAAELARIESKMQVPVVNRVSQAPKPISPLAGTSSPMAFDPEKSSMEEYAARWHAENKQLYERR